MLEITSSAATAGNRRPIMNILGSEFTLPPSVVQNPSFTSKRELRNIFGTKLYAGRRALSPMRNPKFLEQLSQNKIGERSRYASGWTEGKKSAPRLTSHLE
jgi:hypothetical protein